MKKKLSSEFTRVHKSLWLIFIALLLGIIFLSDVPRDGKIIYFVCCLIGAYIFWDFARDLRTVEADARYLYVSDGKAIESIPVHLIRSIDQKWSIFRSPVIVIRFKMATKFGEEIEFLPYYAFILFYGQHPVVKELRQLASLPVN